MQSAQSQDTTSRWQLWSSTARQWTQRELALSRFRGMILWAGLVGFLGAFVIAGFREAMQALELLLTGHDGDLVQIGAELPPWRRVLTPMVGAAVAGLLLQYGLNLVRRRGSTTDYMEAFILGDGYISARASLVKAASSLFSVCSGGSMGREGAMAQLAAMVGSRIARLFDFAPPQRRTLVACGAAAGLAAAYNAPLAGAVFVAEIVVGSIEFELTAPIIVSAVIANATTHDILGYAPIFDFPTLGLVSPWELVFYLLLGLLAGRLAPIYLGLLKRSAALFKNLPVPIFVRFILGGLGLGLISLISAEVWGNGHSVINSILNDPWTVRALLLLLLLKISATAMTVGSGAVGGVFTPTLLVGAALGALVGTQLDLIAPTITGPADAYAAVGMGAFISATTRAPLMAVLMIFEMTGDYQMVLPLMLSCIAANYVALPYGVSMYSQTLHRKKPGEIEMEDFSLLGRLVPDSPIAVVKADDDLQTINGRFLDTPYNHVQVVDNEGRWLGVIGRKTANAAPPEARASDLVLKDYGHLEAEMTLQQAIHAASAIPSELLPVVEQGKFVGTVAKSDLLASLEKAWTASSSEPEEALPLASSSPASETPRS